MTDLSIDRKVGYSPLERRVFAELGGAPRSTSDIADAIYPKRARPRNARQSVLGALDNLTEKVKANREPFRVKKTKRKGPHPVQFWVEK